MLGEKYRLAATALAAMTRQDPDPRLRQVATEAMRRIDAE